MWESETSSKNLDEEEGDGGVVDLISNHQYRKTELIPLRLLTPMIDAEDIPDAHYLSIINSFEEKGLEYPLIVASITYEDWAKEKRTVNPDILDPPGGDGERFLRIQCGNSRYYIFNGEVETISCDITSLKEAKELCMKRRKDKVWMPPTD